MAADTFILVAGGAGYIGSHMVRMLHTAGFHPVVVDNLKTGHRAAVAQATLVHGDIGDPELICALLRKYAPRCVMHFAAFSLVGESMAAPGRYWQNNLVHTKVLLDAMLACGIGQFVFSSTAAVYGNPVEVPIPESHPTSPINPYGHSKLAVEHLLKDYDAAHGLRSVSLRYFNAAGAHPDGDLGEHHEPETHLIPLVLQAASGRRPRIARYGSNHPTPDGSCVRDYVHVQDLCQAHLLALEYLGAGGSTTVFNLGNGLGHSVNQVIDTARRITGHAIALQDDPPRPGDPPVLVADASRAKGQLGWKPQFSELETIIEHAWRWEQRLAQGAAFP